MSDILGIGSYTEDGRRWFHAAGQGSSYLEFYKWVRSKPLYSERTDFPWHHFSFVIDDDGDELISIFSSSYMGHDGDIDDG